MTGIGAPLAASATEEGPGKLAPYEAPSPPSPREVPFAPGPWAALRAAPGWRRGLPLVAGALGPLPGEGAWTAAVLGRSACLLAALARHRPRAAVAAAAALGGLGEGSTPAGDDYLMGVLHARWALGGETAVLAPARAAAAAARTTRASAAWLLRAGRGEVGPAWQALLLALAGGDPAAIASAAAAVRALGHTSGAFSLRGFVDTLEVTTA